MGKKMAEELTTIAQVQSSKASGIKIVNMDSGSIPTITEKSTKEIGSMAKNREKALISTKTEINS